MVFIFVDAFVVSISLRDLSGLRRHITVEDFLFCFLSLDTNLPYTHPIVDLACPDGNNTLLVRPTIDVIKFC